MSIGFIDVAHISNLSGTSISGETIVVNSLTASTVLITGSSQSNFSILSATSFSASTIQSSGLAGVGTQMVVANTAGVLSVQAIPAAGQSTVIRNGTNTYTAGTSADYTVNVSALTIDNITVSATSNFNSVSASTFSAGTINSGSTNLYSIFSPIGSVVSGTATNVQPGTNTYTGGTAASPTVNISALTINSIIVTGSSTFSTVSATTLSGGTIYSGSTDLSSLFASTSVTTLQTAQLATKVNKSGDTMTGTLLGTAISATTLSGGTIYSGSTDLSSLFASTSVTTLQTAQLATKVNKSGDTMTGTLLGTAISATTLSGGTLYSGSTNLYDIFATSAASGEANTASNLVGGAGIFYQKSGVDLQFKSLSAGTNISINSDNNVIAISSTGSVLAITGTTKINFGYSNNSVEGDYATTAVTNSNVMSYSSIIYRITTSTDHPDAEDSLLDDIDLKESNIVDGVGFTLNAYATNGSWGEYNIYYRILN